MENPNFHQEAQLVEYEDEPGQVLVSNTGLVIGDVVVFAFDNGGVPCLAVTGLEGTQSAMPLGTANFGAYIQDALPDFELAELRGGRFHLVVTNSK